MVKTNAIRSSNYMVLVLLALLATMGGTNAFLGGSGRAKLPKQYVSSSSLSIPHQGNQEVSPLSIGLCTGKKSIRPTTLDAIPTSLPDAIPALTKSLFRYGGQVPLWQAFALNAFLFGALRIKLLKMLTPTGLFHALALGTGLWATLGWRGWTTCVLYLILGSAVTKVKFQEKEKLGIAEGRGGRRGPENVW